MSLSRRTWLYVVTAALGVIICLGALKRWGPSVADWQSYAQQFKHIVDEYYVGAVLAYIVSFAGVVMSGLPFFIPFTLMAGFVFGFLPGLLYAVIGSYLGALGAFLLTHYVLERFLVQRYAVQLQKFKERVERYGSSYILTLNLMMVVPYVVINTVAALAGVPLWAFTWTTIVGSFPMLFIHVLAGQQLQTMTSFSDIVSPRMLIILLVIAACALVPTLVRRRVQPLED